MAINYSSKRKKPGPQSYPPFAPTEKGETAVDEAKESAANQKREAANGTEAKAAYRPSFLKKGR